MWLLSMVGLFIQTFFINHANIMLNRNLIKWGTVVAVWPVMLLQGFTRESFLMMTLRKLAVKFFRLASWENGTNRGSGRP
jgi:hypothetical protein